MTSKIKRSQIQLTDLVSTVLATDASGNIVAGTAGGDMLKSENLSGLANNATARTNIGLGNVDNTSDADKPVSTAQATAIGLKANTASPTFTGTVTLPAGQVVNGVTLTTAGGTTDFLRADGTYATPAGGGGGSPFATDIVVNGQTIGKGSGNISSNTVHGTSALSVNTTGIRNNAIGVNALASNTTGANNIANGVESLQFNTTGSSNNAMGYQSLQNNTTGDSNIAIGSFALYQNIAGSNNTATGQQALSQNSSGSDNTATGSLALASASSNSNTAVGRLAGATVTSGDSNTLIGKEADVSTGTISNSTAVGRGAIATASNQVVIGNGSVTQTVLRGAVTGTSFNGVALTTGGSASNFLKEDGTYGPAGGGGGGSPFATDIVVNGQTIGKGAGNILDNTAQGIDALKLNTTGIGNTATGYNSIAANTTGSYNTGYGRWTLGSNTTGSENTATGGSTLSTNTTGSQNTANGYSSLLFNSAGDNNTSTGFESLRNNTTGGYNTADGHLSLRSNTTGNNNTATGQASLYSNTTGAANTAVGVNSLVSQTTGNLNTAIGSNAGYTLTTGSNNTFVGRYADTSLATVTNSTAIGNGAVVSADNQVVIGNASVTDTVLRGAVTATSFNGVALTTGGGTTNFLRADGTYAAPASSTSNRVSVWHNASQFSSATPNTYTSLAFNQERYDTASMHDNATNNSRLVSQYIGRVNIVAGLSYYSATSGNTNRCRILKNGATVIATREQYDAAGSGNQNYCFDINISDTTTAVTDYYELQIASTANGNLNTYSTIDRVNFELNTLP